VLPCRGSFFYPCQGHRFKIILTLTLSLKGEGISLFPRTQGRENFDYYLTPKEGILIIYFLSP
jgi:hypothetical protein